MVSKGNHPQMAELFRLVKYYNLPSYIDAVFGEAKLSPKKHHTEVRTRSGIIKIIKSFRS